jgi:hypothetical protein
MRIVRRLIRRVPLRPPGRTLDVDGVLLLESSDFFVLGDGSFLLL